MKLPTGGAGQLHPIQTPSIGSMLSQGSACPALDNEGEIEVLPSDEITKIREIHLKKQSGSCCSFN
jgi:hypothetical protein